MTQSREELNGVHKDKLKDTVGAAEFASRANFQEFGTHQRHFLRWAKRKYCAPFQSPSSFFASILSFLPILKWLPRYSWKEKFVYDLLSGLTTGVMFVPQGIAYSYLAGVDPVYGLYSSFFAPLFYIFLGSSPHVSRGPSSVLGIMSGVSNEHIRRSYGEHLLLSSVNSSASSLPFSARVPDAITVAATLTFTIGLLQLCMAIARLEFISDYFSEPLVGGFTSAAAVHVLISQIGVLMGISLPKTSGPGYLFSLLYTLASKIPETNLVSFFVSMLAIAFLMFGKEFINPWLNKKSPIKVSPPYELVVMIIAALIGEVPTGLPLPKLPRLDLLIYTLPNALAISMVTLAMHYSMVKMLASRMHYSVDSGQELYAIGLGSMLSSFFPVYPTSTALGRTMVMVESGARSQISSVISCILLLCVIFWLGPLFRPLPQCILSAVIIVALRPIFRKTSEILEIWQLSKYDAAIWLMSFWATVLTDVISGLCISVAFTLLTIVTRTQWPIWHAHFPTYSTKDEKMTESPDYCVFRFEAFLLFTNAERFRKSVQETLQRWNSNSKNSKPSVGLTTLAKMVLQLRRSSKVVFVNCKEHIRQSLLNAKIVQDLDQDFFASIAEVLTYLNSPEHLNTFANRMENAYNSFRDSHNTKNKALKQ
uniref:SLC26A/SulP transporter domain-containing protein n=1 Tax=Ditylenchus dipsaci TaxID=166011 RepID=A0A915CKY7_9BILA